MASLMDTLADRRTNNNAGLLPFSAQTYAQARCFFGDLVRAMYRLEVVGADHLPVTGPRWPSELARCASKGDYLACSSLVRFSPTSTGGGQIVVLCARRTSTF